MEAWWAANTLCLIPPTGSTDPSRLISPVNAVAFVILTW